MVRERKRKMPQNKINKSYIVVCDGFITDVQASSPEEAKITALTNDWYALVNSERELVVYEMCDAS